MTIYLFLLLILITQIIAYRILIKRSKKKYIINIIFVFFNLSWIFTLKTIFLNHDNALSNNFFINLVTRSSTAWQGTILVSILLLSVAKTLHLFLKKPKEKNYFQEERRDFFQSFAKGTLVTTLAIATLGVYKQSTKPNIKNENLLIPNLPKELDGFKIAHISDVHLGLWLSQKELDTALKVVAQQKPSLVAITGDLVDKNAQFAKLYYQPLQHLKNVPYGVWGILGNHDHYTDAYTIYKHLNKENSGINMLRDTVYTFPNLPITIVGLDDPGLNFTWVGGLQEEDESDFLNLQIMKNHNIPPNNYVILLNHRPHSLKQAARAGCHLYLAGHTHGGQWQVPGQKNINLSSLSYQYNLGLYKKSQCWLNVNPGLGSVGLPYRFMVWPEITIINLKKI